MTQPVPCQRCGALVEAATLRTIATGSRVCQACAVVQHETNELADKLWDDETCDECDTALRDTEDGVCNDCAVAMEFEDEEED